MSGFLQIRNARGELVPLPEGQLFIELLTADRKVAMVIFESEDRIFVEQPGDATFAQYCSLYKQTPAPRRVGKSPV